jgi:AbrB family looped-hinge helix DNA binding protein
MTYMATISSKGQFTIPKALREQYGLMPGDKVSLAVKNGAIILTSQRAIRESITGRFLRTMEARRR